MYKQVGTGLAVAGAIAGGYVFFIRPWQRRWGAPDDEIRRPLPGDDLSPDADSQATRALTIHARPEDIWPWLVQIGQDRAGMYSYTWLENLVGADIHNSNRIIPEFQERKVGDTVWLARKDRYKSAGYAVVGAIEPNRALVLLTQSGWTKLKPRDEFVSEGSNTWAFVLEPLDEQSTRLIVRDRMSSSPDLVEKVVATLAELPHFIMQRKMMLGIKERAERTSRQRERGEGTMLSRHQQKAPMEAGSPGWPARFLAQEAGAHGRR